MSDVRPQTATGGWRRHAKRAFVAAVLLWVFLWPFFHYALVKHWHLNQWKFGGWAMYTMPSPQLSADVTDLQGERLPYHPQDVHNELMYEFTVAMDLYGRLVRPLPVVEAFAQRYEAGSIDGVRYTVQDLRLDPRTGYLTFSTLGVWEVHLDEDGEVTWSGRVE